MENSDSSKFYLINVKSYICIYTMIFMKSIFLHLQEEDDGITSFALSSDDKVSFFICLGSNMTGYLAE